MKPSSPLGEPSSRWTHGKFKTLCCAFLVALALFFFDVSVFGELKREKNATSVYFRAGYTAKDLPSLPNDSDEPPTVQAVETVQAKKIPSPNLEATSSQSLHLDMQECTELNEASLRQAVDDLAHDLGFTLSSVAVMTYEGVGSVLVGIFDDFGHVSVQTWIKSRAVTLDMQWSKEDINIQDDLEDIAKRFGGRIWLSTFSLIPRHVGTNSIVLQEPRDIMPVHAYKKKIHHFTSDDLHIEVWETHDVSDVSDDNKIVRSLYVDGVLKYSDEDGTRLHESMVHSAFVGSSVPPKRVLIASLGDIGLIREALKWSSVEEVTIVYPKQQILQAFKDYFPKSNNCAGFGTWFCLDDPRVKLVQEDLGVWFADHFGKQVCVNADKDSPKNFDVILVESMDVDFLHDAFEIIEDVASLSSSSGDSEADQGRTEDSTDNDDDENNQVDEFKKYDDFFSKLKCGLKRFGVLAVDIGKGPSQFLPEDKKKPSLLATYTRKIKQMSAMTENFWHRRVFDVYIPSRKGESAIAVGMVPFVFDIDDDPKLQQGVFTGLTNGGVNDFDGTAPRVNLKLRRNLLEGAMDSLLFYDGAMQATFKFPRADWKGVHCADPANQKICDIEKTFSKDYEEEIFEYHLDGNGNANSGVVAKRNIPKGTVTGLWDAATDLDIPADSWYRLLHMAEDIPTKFHAFKEWLDIYAYDGGTSGLGDRIYVAINSYHTWLNHACDGNGTMEEIHDLHPWIDDVFYGRWDPVGSRIRSELDHVAIASRDIRQGEFITDDYKKWDGFMRNSDTQTHNYDYLNAFCNPTTTNSQNGRRRRR